ncbi:MAG: acetylglutamate kinase [Clostridia bacterium]|nr:acetylglutamate kinase [Clostridia bacterium]MBR5388603.1 acetylglutamate kinase [Clostridia bacterium]
MLEITNAQRAEVLTQALPYIQKYNGKIVVVKYGGNAMINDELKQQVMEDVVLLHLIGVKVVLVHGGGPEMTETLKKIGKESVFCDGLRVTDKETAEVALMVLAGKINKNLVNLLQAKGGKAIGISGIDGHMIDCEMKDEKLGYVGKIKKVDVSPVTDLLEQGYIPVVSTVGCDKKGNVYNINADTAAAHIAGEMKASRLITLTDIAGIMKNKDDAESLIRKVDLNDIEDLIAQGVITGGMIPKVECCIDAIKCGVHKVIILDGRVPHAILIETLTDEGAGTMVVSDLKKNAGF